MSAGSAVTIDIAAHLFAVVAGLVFVWRSRRLVETIVGWIVVAFALELLVLHLGGTF
jgi:hypothetical protein